MICFCTISSLVMEKGFCNNKINEENLHNWWMLMRNMNQNPAR